MNKFLSFFLVLCAFAISAIAVILESSSYVYYEARNAYRVYLNGESIGLIEDKEKFEDYINETQNEIKNRYNVDHVYIPNGLKIKQETTYNEKTQSIESIYNRIKDEEDFTINGYTITIVDTKETEKEQNKKETQKIKEYLYVLDKSIIQSAVNDVVKSFVDEKQYQDYLNETQKDITNEGTIIENVYIKEQISIKKGRIPANGQIYKTKQELAKYLLFGTNEKNKIYKVKDGDTVKTIAYNNKMSTEEFLIANQDISDENSLLYKNQEVVISYINPIITVVEETHTVKKESIRYKTVEKKDSSMYQGTSKVIQKGQAGESKITRKIDSSGSFTIKNKRFQILNNNIMPKSKINIYISKKIGIIAEHNNTKYKVICSDNLPSKYSSISMNEFYKEHYQELYSFALSLLTYDAKEKEPLLVTS